MKPRGKGPMSWHGRRELHVESGPHRETSTVRTESKGKLTKLFLFEDSSAKGFEHVEEQEVTHCRC